MNEQNRMTKSNLEKKTALIASMLNDRGVSSLERIHPALDVMIANLTKIKTTAALESALITFGKGIV
jgi:hypothetical protein